MGRTQEKVENKNGGGQVQIQVDRTHGRKPMQKDHGDIKPKRARDKF